MFHPACAYLSLSGCVSVFLTPSHICPVEVTNAVLYHSCVFCGSLPVSGTRYCPTAVHACIVWPVLMFATIHIDLQIGRTGGICVYVARSDLICTTLHPPDHCLPFAALMTSLITLVNTFWWQHHCGWLMFHLFNCVGPGAFFLFCGPYVLWVHGCMSLCMFLLSIAIIYYYTLTHIFW